MKELKWENGYTIEYAEELDVVGREPMKISFVVSAEKISVEGAEVNHRWPKKDDEDATLKELKWENGYIVNLEEGIHVVGDHPMLITLTISAQKFTFGDAILEQNWPELN
jgi:hypothetical protein